MESSCVAIYPRVPVVHVPVPVVAKQQEERKHVRVSHRQEHEMILWLPEAPRGAVRALPFGRQRRLARLPLSFDSSMVAKRE